MDVAETFLTPSDVALTFSGANAGIRKPVPISIAAKPATDSTHRISSELGNKQRNSENIRHMIEDLAGRNRELSIAVDQETHEIVVKVLDSETQEVVRQIPPEEALRLAHALKQLSGALVDEVA